MYKIQYLPLALDDLKCLTNYITNELEAPLAAEKLVEKINTEILKISENPFRCHIYFSPVKLKYDYRILNVNNYSIFYVIEKEKIEIHRIIYSKRDILTMLNEN